MSNIHYITYATHDQGMYKKLINNKYNISIITLGWGDKWFNFKQKMKAVYKYCKSLNNNDIIVYLDGFDSYINKDPKNILELFKNYDCKILFSYDFDYLSIQKKINNIENIANAGLFMGYSEEIKEFFRYLLKKNENDDQKLINKYMNLYSYIKIDTKEIIFKNINHYERFFNTKNNALFNQTPFVITYSRLTNASFEYLPSLSRELLILLTILICYLNNKKYKYTQYIIVIIVINILFNREYGIQHF